MLLDVMTLQTEDVMLGSKRTISFWRPKRRLADLERALAPPPQIAARNLMRAQAVATLRARDRLAAAARLQGRRHSA